MKKISKLLMITPVGVLSTITPIILCVKGNNTNAYFANLNRENRKKSINSIITLNDYNAQFKEFITRNVTRNNVTQPYAVWENSDFLNNAFPQLKCNTIGNFTNWRDFDKRYNFKSSDFTIDLKPKNILADSEMQIGSFKLTPIPLISPDSTEDFNSVWTNLLSQISSGDLKMFPHKGNQSAKPTEGLLYGNEPKIPAHNLAGHWDDCGWVSRHMIDEKRVTQLVYDWTQQCNPVGTAGDNLNVFDSLTKQKDETIIGSDDNPTFTLYDFKLSTGDLKQHLRIHDSGSTGNTLAFDTTQFNNFFTKKLGWEMHSESDQCAAHHEEHSHSIDEWANNHKEDAPFIEACKNVWTGAELGTKIWGGSRPDDYYQHVYLSIPSQDKTAAKIFDYKVDDLLQLSYVGYDKQSKNYYANFQFNEDLLAAALGQEYNRELSEIFNKDLANIQKDGSGYKYIPENVTPSGVNYIDWNSHFYFHDILGIVTGDTNFNGGSNTWVPHKYFEKDGKLDTATYANFMGKLKEFIIARLFANKSSGEANNAIHYDNYLKFKYAVANYWESGSAIKPTLENWPSISAVFDKMLYHNDDYSQYGECSTNGWFQLAEKYGMTNANIDYCKYFAIILPQLKISTWFQEATSSGEGERSELTNKEQNTVGSTDEKYTTGLDLLDFASSSNKGLRYNFKSQALTQNDYLYLRFNGESEAKNYKYKNAENSYTHGPDKTVQQKGSWHGCINNVDKLAFLTNLGSNSAISIYDNDMVKIAGAGNICRSAQAAKYYGVNIDVHHKDEFNNQLPSVAWKQQRAKYDTDISTLKAMYIDKVSGNAAAPFVNYNLYDWDDFNFDMQLPADSTLRVTPDDIRGCLLIELVQTSTGKAFEAYIDLEFQSTIDKNITFETKSKFSTDATAVQQFKAKFEDIIPTSAQIEIINDSSNKINVKSETSSISIDSTTGVGVINIQFVTTPTETTHSKFSIKFTYKDELGEEITSLVSGMSMIYKNPKDDFVKPTPGDSLIRINDTKANKAEFTFALNEVLDTENLKATVTNCVKNGSIQVKDLTTEIETDANKTWAKVSVDYTNANLASEDYITFELTFNNTTRSQTVKDLSVVAIDEDPQSSVFQFGSDTSDSMKQKIGTNQLVLNFTQTGLDYPEITQISVTNFKLNGQTVVNLPVQTSIDGVNIKITIDTSSLTVQENNTLTFDVYLKNAYMSRTFNITDTFVKEVTPTPSKKLGTGAIIGISAGSVAVVAGGGVGVAKGVKSHNLKKKEKEFENKTTKSDDKK